METIETAPDALIGSTIAARYTVDRMIGGGGMGVVYAGVQEGLERPVAIKVLKPAYADDSSAIDRMFREARSASRMGHPNICDVYDLGRLPDGRPYMVMPLLQGSDLSAMIEADAPFELDRVAELLSGPAAALDVMHARGIVHRDIKPENIFRVVHADGSEVMQLVDFGLATMHLTDRRLTREGMICGTPQYLAPEAGTGQLPGASGDVYALAVVAFEMLTGTLPFNSPNPMTIVTQKMVNPAPRLAEVSGRGFTPAIEAVLARGLSIDPNQRHQSAGAFVAALLAASTAESPLHGRSVETQPIELPTSARTWKRGLVLVLFSCVATLGVFWLGLFERSTGSATRETQEPPAQHIDEDEGVEEEDATATAGSMPEGVAPEAAIEADSATPQEELTDAAPPRQRNRRPLLRAAADTTAVDPGTMTGSGALPEGTGADTERATRETQAGTDALLRGQLADAIRHLTAATRANPRHAPAYRSLGLARQRMGHDADAARAYRRYLALAPRAADAEIIRRRLSEIDR